MGENNLVWQQFCTNISYNDLKPRLTEISYKLKNRMVSNKQGYKF